MHDTTSITMSCSVLYQYCVAKSQKAYQYCVAKSQKAYQYCVAKSQEACQYCVAKSQEASIKALVQLDFPVCAPSKQSKTTIKKQRLKNWLCSKSFQFVKNYLFHIILLHANVQVSSLFMESVSLFQQHLLYKLISPHMRYLCTNKIHILRITKGNIIELAPSAYFSIINVCLHCLWKVLVCFSNTCCTS